MFSHEGAKELPAAVGEVRAVDFKKDTAVEIRVCRGVKGYNLAGIEEDRLVVGRVRRGEFAATDIDAHADIGQAAID